MIVPAETPPSSVNAPLVVGIGASAGGLEPIEEFIGHIPADSGLAYIVVQHLDPRQQHFLKEILQRMTPLPVREAEQGLVIQPNTIYVITPNTELSVLNTTLQLTKPVEPRGLRLPINVLFSSLARTRRERAVGVILSGMGSDGTLGAQAIKAAGGLTLAQDPASAQFEDMPKSAIESGFADAAVVPAEMPARILGFLAAKAPQQVHHHQDNEAEKLPLQQIVKHLHKQTRHDFSLYKTSTLFRRIERRMAIHGVDTLERYADFLKGTEQETDFLFKELLIGVTDFFRDKPVWDYFEGTVLPELLRNTNGALIRAWCVGCSTGEEAYSLAIAVAEAMERLGVSQPAKPQIFASDISAEAIAVARRGAYPIAICNSISPERLARHFTFQGTHYQINNNIRDMVMFAEHNVVLDPPFTRLHLVLCRNLLIYFDQALQRRLLPLFHYSLRPGGALMLGTSETTGRSHHLFTPRNAKLRLYTRSEASPMARALPLNSFPPLSTIAKEQTVTGYKPPVGEAQSLENAIDHVLLQEYAPPAIVLNNAGDIVYISGHTGKYLEPAAGKANLNFHAMAREGLRGVLDIAIAKAQNQNEPVHVYGLQVAYADGMHPFDVSVQRLRDPAPLQGLVMVVFREVAATVAPAGTRPADHAENPLAAELQRCRDEIHHLRQEARASREELQAANEVLQSTNEELQSANEELTTSKEEMQSMNEELQTINAELHTKLDDLALAQNDLQNTLNNIEIAVLFLDQNLNVRRYTDRAAQIINLRDSDVGRPISDLTSSLKYPEMKADARETLRTLVFTEKQVSTIDHRWFAVKIMPYRRLDNVIDGVVITLVDITKVKELETSLGQSRAK